LEEISWQADDFLGLANNHSPSVVEGGVGMKTSDHVIDTAENDVTFDEEGSDQLILSDIDDDDDDDDDGDVLGVINGGLDMKSSDHVIETVENDHSFDEEGSNQFTGNDIGDDDDGDGDSFPYNDVDDFNVELLEENIPCNEGGNVGHDNDNAHSTSSDSDVSGIKEAHDEELSSSRTGGGAKYNDARWLERFDELEQFKSENGHCNVPSNSKEDPTLAGWVKQQRYQFKLGRILEDRLKRLNEIGFEWSKDDSRWKERFDELEQFKCKHGHCNVPSTSREDPKLARWVRNQRSQFKLGRIPEDRIERLNEIGFEWSLRSS
jgi:hypothetical protein